MSPRAAAIPLSIAIGVIASGSFAVPPPPPRVTPANPSPHAAGNVVQVALASRGDHACARFVDGTLRCWGANRTGQLGDGTTIDHSAPTVVMGLADVRDVSLGSASFTGANHSCAIVASGDVFCWGSNRDGQLGDGTRIDRATPTRVRNLANARQLALGNGRSCALLAGGSVHCWGRSLREDGTRMSVRAAIAGVHDAVEIAMNRDNVCARIADGTVRCFGSNGYAQLARCDAGRYFGTARSIAPLGTVTGMQLGSALFAGVHADGSVTFDCGGPDVSSCSRRAPTGLDHIARLASDGERSFCALGTDGSVRCWGMTGAGCSVRHLGFEPGGFDCLPHGGSPGNTVSCLAPASIAGLTDATQVAVGSGRGCAVRRDGSLLCWEMRFPDPNRGEWPEEHVGPVVGGGLVVPSASRVWPPP